MDIQKIISDILEKLQSDDGLLAKFKENPTKTIEGLIGIDLPDDQINGLITAVKAKLSADKIGDALGGLGKLFGK